jgi:3-oxoacyl-[acyl-carrier protein] reductase
VNVFSPGYVQTDMTSHLLVEALHAIAQRVPMRRIATVDDIVPSAMYLLTAPYITGHELVVDGGLTCGFSSC